MPELPVPLGPSLPALGPRVPKRGGPVSRWVGRTALRLLGWRLVGRLPDLPKFVMVGAPHTSNWDGVVGIAALLALGLDAHFVAKHTLFRPPLGAFLRWVGGVPVRRHVRGGMVGQMVERFEQPEPFVLGVTPEGTRKRVEAWKTGFYRIALRADVPVCLVVLDWGRKEIGPGPSFVLTGDEEADFARMLAFYRGVRGKNPAQSWPGQFTA